jgi:hypothetical protein
MVCIEVVRMGCKHKSYSFIGGGHWSNETQAVLTHLRGWSFSHEHLDAIYWALMTRLQQVS